MHVPLTNGSADLDRNTVEIDGRTVSLSPNEARLFRYLVERSGQTIEQTELLQNVFGYHAKVRSRTVITTMQRLRSKVESDPSEPVHLLSVYGVGYRFEPVGEPQGLVGRSAQLESLRGVLDGGRLWVVAPGGFGKSTLVTHFAATVEGADLVELTGVTTEDELFSAVCRSLRLGTIETADALERALAHRSAPLLVLDTAEELGESLVPFVVAWSAHTPVLVTSRMPCAGEPTMELGPLDPEAAQRLFERSLSRPLAPERVAPLLERLAGVPFALELAGAQLGLFEPEELGPHLDDLGSLLVGGQGRQSSLHAVLDWSWQRTPARARQALGALAPARQGTTIADAARLMGPEGLGQLGELQRWGWVQLSEGRVRLLDPVRQFVEQRWDQRGPRAAHLAHFLRRARACQEDLLVGRDRSLLDDEASNLRAALRNGWETDASDSVELTLLLVPTMGQRVPAAEAIGWLDHAARIATGHQLGDVLVMRSAVWMSRASLDVAEQDLLRAEETGVRDRGLLHLRWGRWHQERMQLAASIEHLEQAVVHLEGAWKLQAQLALSYTLVKSGRDDEAERLLRTVLARSRVLNAPGKTLLALGTLGLLHMNHDDFTAAQDALDEAIELAEQLGDDLTTSKVQTQRGALALYRGETAKAVEHWEAALAISTRLGNRVGAAMARVNLAGLHLVTRELDQAEALLQSARTTFDEAGVAPGAAFARLGLGRLAVLRHEWKAAERWLESCDGRLPAPLAWFVGVERCISRAEQGDLEGAREALEQGAEATDGSSRAGRAIAEAYCRVLAAEPDAHTVVATAIEQARATRDAVIGDLASRLTAFVARR